jgi:hydroxyethylthiazole kinase-like uncharacterized protein yjeF
MSRVLTIAAMREADRRAIEVLGIPSVVLMDRAGHAVFQLLPAGPVVVVCGKGNNGGDGFVVARYSLLAGIDTVVIVLAEDGDLSEDSLIFKNAYCCLGGRCVVTTVEDDLKRALTAQDLNATWVDALLGTGTLGTVSGLSRVAIEHWPDVRTISIDIPSGLNGDTGEVCGVAVAATETIAIQFAKVGFESESALPYLGRVRVVDIGIPEVCADDEAWNRLNLE